MEKNIKMFGEAIEVLNIIKDNKDIYKIKYPHLNKLYSISYIKIYLNMFANVIKDNKSEYYIKLISEKISFLNKNLKDVIYLYISKLVYNCTNDYY